MYIRVLFFSYSSTSVVVIIIVTARLKLLFAFARIFQLFPLPLSAYARGCKQRQRLVVEMPMFTSVPCRHRQYRRVLAKVMPRIAHLIFLTRIMPFHLVFNALYFITFIICPSRINNVKLTLYARVPLFTTYTSNTT